jgi:hypothetical protein
MDPSEFVEKLRTGDFQRGLVLHGLTKKTEEEAETIQFAHGTGCEKWTSIPVAEIESVDLLSVVPCKDHSHPFVRLSLRPPEGDEAKLFADLLNAVMNDGNRFGAPTTSVERTDDAPFPETGEAKLLTGLPGSMIGRNIRSGLSPPGTGNTTVAPFRRGEAICTALCFGGTMYCTCWSPERGWYEYPCGSCLPDWPPLPPWVP